MSAAPTSGTVSFSAHFAISPAFSLFPGAPVHASASQALNRRPPTDAGCLERTRDAVLRFLCRKAFLYIAFVWLAALVGVGAFVALLYLALFLLPEGAIGMSTDEIQWWANACIQILTGLFSYLNTLTLPWRLSILLHLSPCAGRSCATGEDFYGRPCEAIWFHIPPAPRRRVTFCLVASTTCHFATRAPSIERKPHVAYG